jgi:hypothetical protein
MIVRSEYAPEDNILDDMLELFEMAFWGENTYFLRVKAWALTSFGTSEGAISLVVVGGLKLTVSVDFSRFQVYFFLLVVC